MKLDVNLELLPQLAFLVCLRAQIQEVCLEERRQDLEQHLPLGRNRPLDLEHLVMK